MTNVVNIFKNFRQKIFKFLSKNKQKLFIKYPEFMDKIIK